MSQDQDSGMKIVKEVQALGTLYGDQFKAIQALLEKQVAQEEFRAKREQERDEARKVEMEAFLSLMRQLDQIKSSLQEVTAAYISMMDEYEAALNTVSPSM